MLTRETVETLTAAIIAARGREICGFLFADSEGTQQYHAASNLSGSRGAFVISKLEEERILERAHRNGLRLVAFVHSHGNNLRLSSTDAVAFAASGIPWIVVALADDGLRHKWYAVKEPISVT